MQEKKLTSVGDKPMAVPMNDTDIIKAKKLIQEEDQRKLKECVLDLEKLLLKHGFALKTMPTEIRLVPINKEIT